jgi:hypothetical protein
MREAAYIAAFFAGLFLLVAAAAWWRVVREPEQEPTAGRIEIDSRRVRSAAMATAIAFGLSAVAAIAAVLDWIFR